MVANLEYLFQDLGNLEGHVGFVVKVRWDKSWEFWEILGFLGEKINEDFLPH